MRLIANTPSGKLAFHFGASATGWATNVQGLAFDQRTRLRAGIVKGNGASRLFNFERCEGQKAVFPICRDSPGVKVSIQQIYPAEELERAMSDRTQSRLLHLFLRKLVTRASDGVQLIESHCAMCGGFVAASPSLKLVQIAESLHSCRP